MDRVRGRPRERWSPPGAGRRRDRRGWAGGLRARGRPRARRHRGHRPGAATGMAVARRRRVQLPGHGRGVAAGRRPGGRHRAGGAPHPGYAARDAGRRGGPADVRDRGRWATGGGLRSLVAGSGARGPRVRGRRDGAARRGGGVGRVGWRRAGPHDARPGGTGDAPVPRRGRGRRRRIRSWRGPRAWHGRRGSPRGSVSATTSPIPGRTGRPMRASWCSMADMSGSPRFPAGASTSGSCWARRGVTGSPGTAHPPSPMRSSRPYRRPTTIPRPGATRNAATSWPARRRWAAG